MPVNPLLLQELIKKYGVDKIRSVKDSIASRRQQKMFDRVSEKIAGQRLPGEIKDEPLVPMEQEIMSYTDAGDPMQMYEAGQMVANGDILPGVGMMALTLAPNALAKPIQKAVEKKAARSVLRQHQAESAFARQNGLVLVRDPGTNTPLYIGRDGRLYHNQNGMLLPVEGVQTASSASPGNGGFYRSPNSWRIRSAEDGTGYSLVDRTAYPNVTDDELRQLAEAGDAEGWTQGEFVEQVAQLDAQNYAHSFYDNSGRMDLNAIADAISNGDVVPEATTASPRARRSRHNPERAAAQREELRQLLADMDAQETELPNMGREADRLMSDLGLEEVAYEQLPPPPVEIHNPVTGAGIEGTDALSRSGSPLVELHSASGRRLEPDMDISGMSYDDLRSVLNELNSHTDDYLEDAGLNYRAQTALRARVQHAIDHNGQDLYKAWDNMSPEDVVADATRMYPGLADDFLEDYGRVSGRRQDILDSIEYSAAEGVLGKDTGTILDIYFRDLGERFQGYTSYVGDSGKAYDVYDNPLTSVERAKLSGVAKVLNKKLGRKAGVDFTKNNTIEEVAAIQKALRDKDLVPVNMEMPLDVAHMSYFSGNTNAMSDAGRRAIRVMDEQPSGSANLVDDTSTASTPMRPGVAAKRYGNQPGQVTVRFLEDANDPSGYHYVGTNDYDHGFDIFYDTYGKLSMGPKLNAAIKTYVDPNFDASLYNFTPEEYVKLSSAGSRGLYPDLHQRWLDMSVIADKASMGPMLKYQSNLENAIRKSGIEGTENFVVPRARLFDTKYRRFTSHYQPGYEFPWMGIYKNKYGGFLHHYYGGGKIHIKPENRGKFTALLKRTGKTASWFKAHGTPAQKKMAGFALNSRKWKHEDGGFLRQYPDGGKMYGTGSPSSGMNLIMNPVMNLFHAAKNKYLTDYANRGRMYSYPLTTKALLEDYILSPYNYKRRYRTGIPERDQKALDEYLNESAQRRALFAKYYNLEDTDFKPEDYITESRYRPSKSTNPDAKYYTYRIDDTHDRFTSFLDNNGRLIIDEGNDENGNYMSIYDIWDLAPFGSRVGNQMGGTPIEMYDRFYESENPKVYYRLKGLSNKDEYASGGRIKGKTNGKFYVTELNDRREKKFRDWYANAAATLGLDPNPDAYEHAYDYRGYWLNNRDADVSSPDFHFPDTWKQPHHPTFSDESIYAKGHEGVGHWEGETFVPGPFNNIMQATEPSVTISEEAPITYGSNYTPSDNILQYIKDIEAFRDQWYQDGNGVWTVGYGFTGDDVRRRYPNGMTRAEADQYFADTVSRRIPMFVKATPNFDKLNQNQRDALFSYYYNIGHGGYTDKSPNMQAGLRNMDLDTVVNNIDFGYNDKKNRGLRKRRDYERKLFGTPMDYGGILNRLRNVYGDNESVKAAILRAKNVKK